MAAAEGFAVGSAVFLAGADVSASGVGSVAVATGDRGVVMACGQDGVVVKWDVRRDGHQDYSLLMPPGLLRGAAVAGYAGAQPAPNPMPQPPQPQAGQKPKGQGKGQPAAAPPQQQQGRDGAAGYGGRVAYVAKLPRSWVTDGRTKPFLHKVRMNTQEARCIQEYFESCKGLTIPGARILKIQRNENVAMYARYSTHRDCVCKEGDGGNERWLWHGSNAYEDILAHGRGIAVAFASQEFNVYGVGNYFAPDPRLSDFFVSGSDRVRHLILCRVAVGSCCEVSRVLPAGSSKEQWTAALRLPVNKMAKDGFHSHTSRNNTEIIVFENSHAFPAYLITFERTRSAGDPYQDSALLRDLHRIKPGRSDWENCLLKLHS